LTWSRIFFSSSKDFIFDIFARSSFLLVIDALQDVGDLLFLDPPVHFAVDNDDRGQAAGADTAQGVNGKLAVRGRLAGLDLKLILKFVQQFSEPRTKQAVPRQTLMICSPFGTSEKKE
jgi:hypothetical protein